MSENKIEREHFAFLRSYWEQIKLLPSKKQRCEVFEAIMQVQFFENEINSISFSSQNQMILWEGLKPILKQSQKGYLDKMGLGSANPSQGAKQGPSVHKDKEEDKDKEFEREGEEHNSIYFYLLNNERLKEVESYIDHLKDQEEYVKSVAAFKRKINIQLEKKDKHQLMDFERWYLEKECLSLKEKYVGSYIDDSVISNIYPYFHTEKYDPDNKFIVWLDKDTDASRQKFFSTKSEIEEYLEFI